MGKNTILVFCAHPDDQIFGPGGTLAKYANKGKKIHTFIFSYGEGSHPHFKKEIITDTRVKEAERADKIIGGNGVEFFGLPDDKNFEEEYEKQNIHQRLKDIILKCEPVKIFTHSEDDHHVHHKIVNKAVLKAVDESKFKTDVYTFDVWNFFGVKRNTSPKLVVDISDTFKTKIKALKIFKSQLSFFSYTIMNNFLYLKVYFNDFIEGIIYKKRFAEVFYKVR